MLKIVNLEPNDYSNDAKCILQENFNYVEISSSFEFDSHIKDADVLISRLTYKLDSCFLQKCSRLKYIVSATTGINHIDLVYCKSNKISVISLKGEFDFLSSITSTAEHTWGLIISLNRNYKAALRHVENFGWDRDLFISRQLSGLTLGIIGYGRLGKIIAKYADAFGMKILINDIRPLDGYSNFVSLDYLLSKSDIVTLHIPYSDDNRDLISYNELALMKKDSLIINTSRGGVLNQTALFDALTAGDIAGAALDVLDGETSWSLKSDENDSLINYAKNNSNLIVTPHIGGACRDAMHKTEFFVIQKLIKELNLHA